MDFGDYHPLFPGLIKDDVKVFQRITHEKFTVLFDLHEPDISRENASSYAAEKLPSRESLTDLPRADPYDAMQ
jgi:hypothetical protein